MLSWKRHEVFVTQSEEAFNAALRALHNAAIEFDMKTVKNGLYNQINISRFNERAMFAAFYYIYVKKNDVERAKNILRQVDRL